ncbi:hypothetical protein CKO28_08375 [Rhodovibrio sodomensis]|uniref:Helix-turn-helix transcriptional regulator n=1 Tax=Rhodovibrio sodomensis TaxID=1088 RepID=A0ABS1DDL4_9PROT|nr:LuxR C-terminal-related transcriptional regulator [Rhodovibrio sodomensis]MBK1668051.1 hypothetical protein [Rhodovibrio sodomensis]
MTVVWPFISANELSQDRIETRLLIALLESLRQAAFMVDHGTRTILACNSRAEQVFGYSADQMVGQSTLLLHLNAESCREFGENGTPVLENGQPFHTRLWMRRACGACFPSENTVMPLQDVDGRQVALSLVRDLSEESPSTRFSKVYGRLTPREQEVFALTARGLSAKEVARNLQLSHRTVEQHRNSVLHKFQMRSVKQLLAEVATLGAVSQARMGQAAE